MPSSSDMTLYGGDDEVISFPNILSFERRRLESYWALCIVDTSCSATFAVFHKVDRDGICMIIGRVASKLLGNNNTISVMELCSLITEAYFLAR